MPKKINIETAEVLDALCGLVDQYMPSKINNGVKIFEHQF